jgi:glycosyltransferase involved in cell wall biosynthesis
LIESCASLSGGQITLIRQKNAGPAAARNAGVASAHGQYIAFLDADDQWLPGKLRAQAELLDRNPEVALVCTPMNGRKFRTRSSVLEISFGSLLLSNRVYTSSVMVRKSAFLSAGAFNPARKLSEDYEVWLKIAAKNSIQAINKPYLLYSKNTGISSKLWRMERGELETYHILYRDGLLSLPLHGLLRYWSLAKFFIRYAYRSTQIKWSRIW